MLGAIIGDIAGSRFEGFSHNNIKTKEFELLSAEHGCQPTDDSIMMLALAKAILVCNEDYSRLEEEAVKQMQSFGRRYPDAGYGGYFYEWIFSKNPQPYYSFGNGAAMRVSPCGFAAKTLEEAVFLSQAVTKVTHNHPEGMKAAEAVSVAIFMARTGKSMEEIRKHITENYYNIRFTLNTIRRLYRFDVTCQGSVPQAFEAFFESTGFEDAIRNAISIGGDSDTIAAIAGGMAEAYYGIPSDIREKALTFLDDDLATILHAFESKYKGLNVAGDNKNKIRVARRDDWKTEPMPEQHDTFVLNRSFSDKEMDALRCGNIPQAMEDKWFWYMEGSTLWAHRSWTGCCIYRIDFKDDNNHVVMVNRDPEQYRCTNIEEDIESLNKLLDWWTQTPYDHYHEWLSETYDILKKAGKV